MSLNSISKSGLTISTAKTPISLINDSSKQVGKPPLPLVRSLSFTPGERTSSTHRFTNLSTQFSPDNQTPVEPNATTKKTIAEAAFIEKAREEIRKKHLEAEFNIEDICPKIIEMQQTIQRWPFHAKLSNESAQLFNLEQVLIELAAQGKSALPSHIVQLKEIFEGIIAKLNNLYRAKISENLSTPMQQKTLELIDAEEAARRAELFPQSNPKDNSLHTPPHRRKAQEGPSPTELLPRLNFHGATPALDVPRAVSHADDKVAPQAAKEAANEPLFPAIALALTVLVGLGYLQTATKIGSLFRKY